LSQQPVPGTHPAPFRTPVIGPTRAGPARGAGLSGPRVLKRAGLGRAAPLSPIWPCTRWGFPCLRACARSGGLLPRLFTLTQPLLRPGGANGPGLPIRRRLQEGLGGMFSVALSVAKAFGPWPPRVSPGPAFLRRRPRVTRHRALWCSDFPPPASAGSDPPPFQNQPHYTPGTRREEGKRSTAVPAGRISTAPP